MTAHPVERVIVSVQVGDDRLAASDDPVFLGLRGTDGREFRLAPAKGKAWRRGAKERFVLGGPDDPETNVAYADLNDPGAPAVDGDAIVCAVLRKGLEPIPNVRGHGEMDDRVQVVSIEVEVHCAGRDEPRRFARRDPFWLGLVCGLEAEIPPVP